MIKRFIGLTAAMGFVVAAQAADPVKIKFVLDWK